MSITFGQHLFDLRRLLKDRRGPDYVFPTTLIEDETNNAIDDLASEFGFGEIVTDGWVSIAAGVDLYTVTLPTGTAGIENLQSLVTNQLKWPMRKLTKEEMISRKVGAQGSTRRGHPITGWYLYETDTRDLMLQVDPIPTLDDSLNAVWTYQHQKVGQVDTSSDSSVSQNIMFAKKGCTALKLRVAAKLVKNATDEDLARLKINRQAAQEWNAESESIALDEYFRITQGNRVGHIERKR